MTTVLFNPDITDEERRTRLYGGQVLVYAASPESLALVEHARNLIAEAFGSKDPQTAQHDMPVEEFAALLAELKPKFIHHPDVEGADQGAARGIPTVTSTGPTSTSLACAHRRPTTT